MTVEQLTRAVLREKETIAKREAAERERKAAEERKRAEDAERERITKTVREYVAGLEEVKTRERDLAAIDKEIGALGDDIAALQSRWDGFTNSRVANEWRQELKMIPTAGVQPPNHIPPGFTASDMERLDAYGKLQRQRAPMDTLLSDARRRLRTLVEDEPALRAIGGN